MLGIDDGHLRAGSDGGEPGDGAMTEDAGFVYADGAAVGDTALPPARLPDGATPVATCDPSVIMDAVNGVFVTTTGTLGGPCTQAEPCKTVQEGIAKAYSSALTTLPDVYVADGTYIEQLQLRPGVTVVGGWTSTWERDCSQETTRIQAPVGATTTVIASSLTAAATLSTLTLWSEAAQGVQPGDTLIGLAATGSSTVVNLKFVDVRLANGGDGQSGGPGTGGGTPSGTCLDAGQGAASVVLGGKGAGADAGWFVATGYVALPAGTGGPGGNGDDGTPGGAGDCVTCVPKCTGSVVCTATDGGMQCGEPGTPGCGGLGGGGGAGGGPGGSSIAILASDAKVNLTSCLLNVGSGGSGGPGGEGGVGGSGAAGAFGAMGQACTTSCAALNLVCGPTDLLSGDGGTPGGVGGSGAQGGPGGDGAGGDSFTIVTVGNGKVVPDAITLGQLVVGTAGLSASGGGNGAPGAAGTTLSQ